MEKLFRNGVSPKNYLYHNFATPPLHYTAPHLSYNYLQAQYNTPNLE